MKIYLVFHIGLFEFTDNLPKEQKPIEFNEKTQEPLWKVENIFDYK